MILRNVKLFFPVLDKPSGRFNPEKPTWQLQIRTWDKEQKNEWIELGLLVKAEVPDEGEPYWRCNLRKNSIKADGTAAAPPEVVGADLAPINPRTIGNGSEGHVQIFQYEYRNAQKGVPAVATVLMGVQVTKLVPFEARERETFTAEGTTEIVE
jgi:hypothetical protein